MAFAQLGGDAAFRILDIPNSARTTALGGNYIAVFDNDINLVSRTFGFDTAVDEAVESIRCAHTEAELEGHAESVPYDGGLGRAVRGERPDPHGEDERE